MATQSIFTSKRTKNHALASGTYIVDLARPSGGVGFATTITALAPGHVADRLVTLRNTGSTYFSSGALTITAPTTSMLDSDAVNGPTLQIGSCSVPWTQPSGTAAATCRGTQAGLTSATPLSSLESSRPTYTSDLAALTGGTDHLRFRCDRSTAASSATVPTLGLAYGFTATRAAGQSDH